MIISHENEFIFFKPLKSAGSSVEFALGNQCGKNDILTGSPYRDEIEAGYQDRNNGRYRMWISSSRFTKSSRI